MDVWLEAALNGPWGRDRQPGIPVTADEIVADALAAAGAGAAVIHLHAYDERTGRQRDAYEIYAPIIERIRSSVDVVCCPTIPFAGSGDSTEPLSPAERFAAVERLLEAGLIEWSVVDPGSVNISLADDVAQGREGFVYANPESHVRHGLALAQAHRMTPSYAIYEPGFLRLLRDEAPGAPWMVAGLGVDVEPLIGAAVRAGGHVRAGLEDAPLGCPDGNRELVERAARLIIDAGGTLATAAQVRAGTAGLP